MKITSTTTGGNLIIKQPIFKCSVCGKKSTWFFVNARVDNIEPVSKPVLYSPYKIGKEYRICFPCFYKKMGIKP
jgi:hypothetical protein